MFHQHGDKNQTGNRHWDVSAAEMSGIGGAQEACGSSDATSLPDRPTPLVAAAPSYPNRMAFRIMLRTGLRVSEALSLSRSDLRLGQTRDSRDVGSN